MLDIQCFNPTEVWSKVLISIFIFFICHWNMVYIAQRTMCNVLFLDAPAFYCSAF